MNIDSFVLGVNTKDFIKEFKNLEEIFDFSYLDKNHELIRNRIKKLISFFKIETLKKNWTGEFVCLRSKMYSFKGGDDIKNKLKGVCQSQSEHNKFEKFKKKV